MGGIVMTAKHGTLPKSITNAVHALVAACAAIEAAKEDMGLEVLLRAGITSRQCRELYEQLIDSGLDT